MLSVIMDLANEEDTIRLFPSATLSKRKLPNLALFAHSRATRRILRVTSANLRPRGNVYSCSPSVTLTCINDTYLLYVTCAMLRNPTAFR